MKPFVSTRGRSIAATGLIVALALAACTSSSPPAAPTTAPKAAGAPASPVAQSTTAPGPGASPATKASPAPAAASPAAKVAPSPSPARAASPSPSPAPSPIVGRLIGTAPPLTPQGATCWDIQQPSAATFRLGNRTEAARPNAVQMKTTDVGGFVCLRGGFVLGDGVSRILVGLGTLQTGNLVLDSIVRDRLLETNENPTGTLFVERIDGIRPNFGTVDGPVAGQVIGTLRFGEIDIPMTFDAEGQVRGGILTGTATSTLTPSDLGVQVAQVADFARVEDAAQITFDFTAKRRG